MKLKNISLDMIVCSSLAHNMFVTHKMRVNTYKRMYVRYVP